VIAAVAVLGVGCTSHSSPASSAHTARLVIAPVTRQSKLPCHTPAVLDASGQRCLALGPSVASTADVSDATVMYQSSGATWAVALTLDSAANSRIARLTPRSSAFPTGPEIAVVVDGRAVAAFPFARSGESLVIESLHETRAQAIALARRITGRAPSVVGAPNDAELTLDDHWHVALGVDDCGTWVPNWSWPPGNVTNFSAVGAGAPARAGSNGQVYAGLHSHGDGLIHLEAGTSAETGAHATLGLYFRYGGWKLSADTIDFVNVHEKNGDSCHAKPGVLRWAVNGVEQHGDPATYRLLDGDVVELVFTTADAAMPPKTAVPSYASLRSILGFPG
jgi:hypothetical protein